MKKASVVPVFKAETSSLVGKDKYKIGTSSTKAVDIMAKSIKMTTKDTSIKTGKSVKFL